MKNRLSIFISTLLALLVLGASTSWTFGTHYCGTIKIDTALFGTPETCGMDMGEDTAQSKPSCCNEIEEIVAPTLLYKQVVQDYVFFGHAVQFIPLTPYVAQAALYFVAPSLDPEDPPPSHSPLPLYIAYEQFLI